MFRPLFSNLGVATPRVVTWNSGFSIGVLTRITITDFCLGQAKTWPQTWRFTGQTVTRWLDPWSRQR